MDRTRRLGPKTSCLGFPRYFTLFGSPDGSESCEIQPVEKLSQLQHPCPRFFRFEG